MSLNITFENPSKSFYSGQVIRGKVIVQFDKPKNIKKITLDFVGRSRCFWIEQRTHHNDHHDHHNHHTGHHDHHSGHGNHISQLRHSKRYSGETTYFKMHLILTQQPKEFEISGTHTYDFHYNLPPNLPPSLEEHFGHTRYKVKAIVDRPWRIDYKCKERFTILPHLDLNYLPQARTNLMIQTSKSLKFLLVTSGNVSLTVCGPKTGFACGEPVMLSVQVDNDSESEVSGIVLEVEKRFVFTAQHPRRNTRHVDCDIVTFHCNQVVGAKQKKQFYSTLIIPSTLPTTLVESVVSIQYLLKVICKIDGLHFDLKGECPVFIGTVPCSDSVNCVPCSVPTQMHTASAPPFGW